MLDAQVAQRAPLPLATTLKKNPVLTRLVLASNGIGCAGAKSQGRTSILAHHHSLCVLHLHVCSCFISLFGYVPHTSRISLSGVYAVSLAFWHDFRPLGQNSLIAVAAAVTAEASPTMAIAIGPAVPYI